MSHLPAGVGRAVGLHPRKHGRWAGRWRGGDGKRVYGLFDPATGAVEVVDPAQDRELPALPQWLPRGRLVAYRPNRRAVVLVNDPTRYVKIVRPGRAATLVRAHDAVAAVRPRGGPAFPAVAPVLEWSDDEGVVVLGEVAGRSLHGLGADSKRATADVASVGAALAAFHRPVTEDHHLPPSGGRSLEDWLAHVAPFLTDASRATYETTLLRLPTRPMPDGAPHLVHGDLHDRNLVVGGGAVGLLDLDSLGIGHPAQDVGNLAAHLVLRSLQATGDADRGCRQALVLREAYRTAGGPAGDDPVTAAFRRALFRLACVYAIRPRWSRLCPALLGEAGTS